MKKHEFVFGALLGAALGLAGVALPAQRVALARSRVVAYVPNWIDVNAFADTIDYARLTHINIAFENPLNADGDLDFHPADDALIARAHAHHVPVLISIGGGGASEDKTMRSRYFDLIGDAKRAGFVAKLTAYVTAHHFDGLDVDLEGAAINRDYRAFIQALRDALKPQGKLLTAALSQGNGGANVPDVALACFDWVNIMAYDASGPWNPNAPGQHSSLEFTKSTVAYWLKRGLPNAKAVVGVPFYGYGFGAAYNKTGYAYSELVIGYKDAANADQVGNTIWYNGLPTIRAKARFVREQKLGGIMIWSLNQDAPGDNSLLAALAKALGR